MLETVCSPLAEVETISAFVLPSEPGAPLGQSGISASRFAAISAAGQHSQISTTNLNAPFTFRSIPSRGRGRPAGTAGGHCDREWSQRDRFPAHDRAWRGCFAEYRAG